MNTTTDNTIYLDHADSYDVENDGRVRTMLRKAGCVAHYIGADERARAPTILEVGCGTGLFTRLLADFFSHAHITATDAFAPMLEIARKRLQTLPNVTLEQYDAETSGNFASPFDIVCGVDIIHHLNSPVQAMRHWLNFVKPGGRMVFFESNAWNPVLRLRMLGRPEEVRFKYNTRGNLISWMEAAGWSETAAQYIPLYLPNGPRRLRPMLDRIETTIHKLVIARPVAGGMIVLARAG